MHEVSVNACLYAIYDIGTRQKRLENKVYFLNTENQPQSRRALAERQHGPPKEQRVSVALKRIASLLRAL